MDTVNIEMEDGSVIRVPEATAIKSPHWWKDQDHALVFDLNPDMDIAIYTDSLPVDAYAEGNIQQFYEDYMENKQCVWSDGEIKYLVHNMSVECDDTEWERAHQWIQDGCRLVYGMENTRAVPQYGRVGDEYFVTLVRDIEQPQVVQEYIEQYLDDRIVTLSRGEGKIDAGFHDQVRLSAALIDYLKEERVVCSLDTGKLLDGEMQRLKDHVEESIRKDHSVLAGDNTSPAFAKGNDGRESTGPDQQAKTHPASNWER